MEQQTHETTATTATFGAAVIDGSADVPVLVDFWAPWCGPCRTLMPLLERIVASYSGRVRLVKVNTDEEPEIAAHYGIRSLPTVVLFKDGRPAEQFVGVQSEGVIRALIDRHATSAQVEAVTPLVERASLELQRRDVGAAATTLAQIRAVDADHAALRPLAARLGFLETVVARPDRHGLRAALDADPSDSAARHALAAHHAVAGDFATALSEWLELLRRDRRYGDDLARRSMLAVFDVLGDDDPLVASYRRRMASALH